MPSVAWAEVKLGVGFGSALPRLAAPSPRPRLANAFHMMSWLAPPKRMRSAASMASRASTMLTWLTAIRRNESNTSCIQRRLPGQSVTCRAPVAHSRCTRALASPYRFRKAARTSKLVALQTSPEACTCRPTKS